MVFRSLNAISRFSAHHACAVVYQFVIVEAQSIDTIIENYSVYAQRKAKGNAAMWLHRQHTLRPDLDGLT